MAQRLKRSNNSNEVEENNPNINSVKKILKFHNFIKRKILQPGNLIYDIFVLRIKRKTQQEVKYINTTFNKGNSLP